MNLLIDSESLLGALSQREQSAALLFDDICTWSVAEVIEAASEIRNTYPLYEGKSIILALSNKMQFILWLCALDGFASKILLASDDDLVSIDDSVFQPHHVTALILDSGIRECQTNVPSSAHTFTQWCLLTSGTTATPKLITHSLADLSSKITDIRSPNTLRWGLLYQQSRFAGLQVVLQALLGGGELVVSNHEQLRAILDSFATSKVNALSATPSYWRKVLMSTNYKSLSLLQVTLGGEIVDGMILQQLKQVFPTARIRHIYASTEAGVGFSVCDGESGFPKAFLAEKKLEIRNGFLWTAPSSLDPQGNVDMINTGDLVELKGNRVYFLGREHGVINVGGNKVFPEAVEIAIRTIEEVADVRVFPMKNPIMGQLVAADIVPKISVVNKVLFKQKLVENMLKILRKHEVPMLLFLKKEIVLSNNAKVVRN